jgi:hypothetical protein
MRDETVEMELKGNFFVREAKVLMGSRIKE